MDPFLISQLAGAATTVPAVIAAEIAYQNTGNGARIKELNQSQGTRRLTYEGETAAGLNQEAAQMGADAQNNAIASQMAAEGGTSGRDVAAMAAARLRSTREGADAAKAAWTGEYRAEGQEDADRKAIRQQHVNEMINMITQSASSDEAAVGTHMGLTDKGKKSSLDFQGDDAAQYLFENGDDDMISALMGDIG